MDFQRNRGRPRRHYPFSLDSAQEGVSEVPGARPVAWEASLSCLGQCYWEEAWYSASLSAGEVLDLAPKDAVLEVTEMKDRIPATFHPLEQLEQPGVPQAADNKSGIGLAIAAAVVVVAEVDPLDLPSSQIY